MISSSYLLSGADERHAQMDTVLEATYGRPEGGLRNKSDPLDEAINIIFSFQTDLARVKSTWSKLRMAYPTWENLARGSADEVAAVLHQGGLQKQKALAIWHLLPEVELIADGLLLDRLQTMSDEDAEALLMRLPGLSCKAARCVLLYSRRRDVFPIDSNTFRNLERAGILSSCSAYRRRILHDAIRRAVSGASPPCASRESRGAQAAYHVNRSANVAR